MYVCIYITTKTKYLIYGCIFIYVYVMQHKERKDRERHGAEEFEVVHGEYQHIRREWETEEAGMPPPPTESCFDVRVNSKEINLNIWSKYIYYIVFILGINNTTAAVFGINCSLVSINKYASRGN